MPPNSHVLKRKDSLGQIWKRTSKQGNEKEPYHKLTYLKINCPKENFMLSDENKVHNFNNTIMLILCLQTIERKIFINLFVRRQKEILLLLSFQGLVRAQEMWKWPEILRSTLSKTCAHSKENNANGLCAQATVKIKCFQNKDGFKEVYFN